MSPSRNKITPQPLKNTTLMAGKSIKSNSFLKALSVSSGSLKTSGPKNNLPSKESFAKLKTGSGNPKNKKMSWLFYPNPNMLLSTLAVMWSVETGKESSSQSWNCAMVALCSIYCKREKTKGSQSSNL